MKILRLQSSNIMRLVAVDITPEGNLVIVGGKNDAGKSSVLNSIAMALGGKAMCPVEPIRNGESEAKIQMDLGDLRVTRTFKRDKVHEPSCASLQPVSENKNAIRTCDCSPSWGETKSTLVVTNKDGAQYPSPQAMLDKLLGKLTFDPLAFKDLDPKPQDEMLRRLVGLDVTTIEQRRRAAFDQRAMLKKTHEIKAAQLLALPRHDDVPEAEVSMDAVSQEMLKAEELRKLAEDAERVVESRRHQVSVYELELKALQLELKRFEEALVAAQDKYSTFNKSKEDAERELDAAQITAQAARAVVPDVSVVRARLAEVEATNAKVRANQLHATRAKDVAEVADEVKRCDVDVKAAEDEKRKALDAAQFPVAGLGVSDDGVTFNGLPFSQASSSEQLRVSVAIGLALNPTLKVLLIRNGNLLDEDKLKLVAEQAEAADAQVWMEYVTSKDEGVQVMIEDGHVA